VSQISWLSGRRVALLRESFLGPKTHKNGFSLHWAAQPTILQILKMQKKMAISQANELAS